LEKALGKSLFSYCREGGTGRDKKKALEGESRAKFFRGKNFGLVSQPADDRIL
jgi:hypothetical protein